jgi:chromosome segregation ATPase
MLNEVHGVDHENAKKLVASQQENKRLKSRVDSLLEEKIALSDEVVAHTITNNALERRCQKLLEKNDQLSIVNEDVATRNDTLSRDNDTLKHQNEAWSTQFTELENKYESFLTRYERLKTRFSTLKSEYDEKSTQSRDLQTENDELRQINQELGQKREETRFEVKELEKTHLACTTDLMTINSNQQNWKRKDLETSSTR